jgi:LAO/AO transport system kinase
MQKLIEGVVDGKSRFIARAISMVENNDEGKNDLLARIFPHTGKALIIGITGSPGAGKSSLTDVLIKVIRQGGAKVGIIAVDPSSPFTGGALLGDRIRMQDHALDPEVFIRSMATRGRLGGLSRATKDAVKVLDAAGFEVIIVETVGVGQSELEVMTVADTILVVLNPAGGDYIQVIKAGIMELADIFVVNKADLPGAEKTAAEVEAMLDLSTFASGWRPPVVSTVSIQNKGIDHLWSVVEKHHQF